MEDFSALTAGERALLEAFNRRGVRFLVVGLSAAVLQGANSSTRDIDLRFADTSDPLLGEAVREAKGIWIPFPRPNPREQARLRTSEGPRRDSRA